ncbi:unnamed protein product [Sphagnum jensenii]
MAGARPLVNNGSPTAQLLQPGDTLIGSDVPLSISSTTGTTIAATSLLGGVLVRNGSTSANFTDTLDTAANILLALSGGNDNNQAVVTAGSSFQLRLINTTGYTETVAAGTGVTLNSGASSGGTFTIATNGWRDLLFVVNSTQPTYALQSTTTSASTSVTFVLAPNQVALPIGPSAYAVNLQNGAAVTGTGIASGTTVAGITQGQGGVTGVTLSGTATATGTVALTFGPSVAVYDIGGSSGA